MRKFAISDIHGCLKTFQALLHKIQFSRQDELYLLGDYVDRGPNTKGVIDFIWQLQQEGYSIQCLRGNHEQMLLDNYFDVSDEHFEGEKNTLASFGVPNLKDIPHVYIAWLDALPYFLEVENYLLVHAGFDFSNDDPMSNQKEMLWIRFWYDSINYCWLGHRIIVHGHTPTSKSKIKEYVEKLLEYPAIGIDAGCAFESFSLGYLCAFDMTNREFSFQPRIDKLQRQNIISKVEFAPEFVF